MGKNEIYLQHENNFTCISKQNISFNNMVRRRKKMLDEN